MCVAIVEGKARLAVMRASAVVLLGISAFACPAKAPADTPAQVQKAIQAVCDRAVASYGRRDLAGFMAIYSPDFVVSGVIGRKVGFRRNEANIANQFARNDYRGVGRCTVSEVLPDGSHARAMLHWHFTNHHSRSASPPHTRLCETTRNKPCGRNPLPAGMKQGRR